MTALEIQSWRNEAGEGELIYLGSFESLTKSVNILSRAEHKPLSRNSSPSITLYNALLNPTQWNS